MENTNSIIKSFKKSADKYCINSNNWFKGLLPFHLRKFALYYVICSTREKVFQIIPKKGNSFNVIIRAYDGFILPLMKKNVTLKISDY